MCHLGSAPFEGRAARRELVRHPARSETEVESTVRETIDGCRGLGQLQRRMERSIDDRHAETDPRGAGRHEGENGERIEHAVIGGREPLLAGRGHGREQSLEGPE